MINAVKLVLLFVYLIFNTHFYSVRTFISQEAQQIRSVQGRFLGGFFYSSEKIIPINYDIKVNNTLDLINSIKKVKNNQVIYLEDGATFDLTGYDNLVIRDGVKLISGLKGKGATIILRRGSPNPLLLIRGEKVSIRGIRFKGPTASGAKQKTKFTKEEEQFYKERGKQFGVSLETYEKMYAIVPTRAILAENQKKHIVFEVSDCEFLGWTRSGIEVGRNAFGNIHHNFIHQNNHYGLGYGVSITYGKALIQGNYFNDNRHSVHGRGTPGTGYEASFNEVGPLASSHAFDMHGGADRRDGTNIAGAYVNINNNVFRLNEQSAVVIRGYSENISKVVDNIIISPNKRSKDFFFKQINSTKNVIVEHNKFILDIPQK